MENRDDSDQVVRSRAYFSRGPTRIRRRVAVDPPPRVQGSSSSPRRVAWNRATGSRHPSAKSYLLRSRRRIVVTLAVALTLLGYAFQIRRIMDAASRAIFRYEGGGVMMFPRSFLAPLRPDAHFSIPNSTDAYVWEAEWKRAQALSESRTKKRRARTRPPASGEATPNIPDLTPYLHLTLDLPIHHQLDKVVVDRRARVTRDASSSTNYGLGSMRRHLREDEPQEPSLLCGPHAKEASEVNPNNYPLHASIGPESRVVITGALSQLGMELILQLNEECGVERLVGIDPLYPNTRHERMEAVEHRYKYVQRRVPVFQRLIVPLFGIHLQPHVGDEKKYEKMGKGFDLVDRLNPTHIVHLAGVEEGRGEHVDYGDTDDASPFATDSGRSGMMRRFDALLSMDQVLSSLAKFKDQFPDKQQPQLVYVSSNEADDLSGVSLGSSNTTAPLPASVYGTTSLLKEVLASYYYKHHGVESVGLRIPTVFGPFARPGSVLHDMAERTVRNAVGKNDENVLKYHLDRDRYKWPIMLKRRQGGASGAKEQVAYVYDVVSSIVAAMQFRPSNPSVPSLVRIGSAITVSMPALKKLMEDILPPGEHGAPVSDAEQIIEEANAMVFDSPGLSTHDGRYTKDILGWTHQTTLREGTMFTLASQILKAYPFGLPASLRSRSMLQNLLDNSLSDLAYHSLPCAAGCRWGGGFCSSSPWDDVVETTRDITQSCRYVIYTVDLSFSLEEIEKQSSPSQRQGWEDQFCKIAFVSSRSKFTKSVYGKKVKDTPLHEWNGKRKSGHWIIVAVVGAQSTMPESHRSLAKLTPHNLFHERVEKAMFVDHQRFVVGTDTAMGVMGSMDIKARVDTEQMKSYDKRKKKTVRFELPPHPARRSVFFTNKYLFPGDVDTNSAENLARFLLSYANIPQTKGIRAQIEFYDQVGHLVRTNMQRSPNYQVLNQGDNLFSYDFLQTFWLVHRLKTEEGRFLRCEMYEEHSSWGSNYKMEDLSMGYVLARRKVLGQTGGKVEDLAPVGPEEWYPLTIPGDEGTSAEGPVYVDHREDNHRVAMDSKGRETHLTFVPQKRKRLWQSPLPATL
ncbi:hypothetical protein ACHAWF_009068 [Thalassiosira exigua]